jgi:hypothetical protein
MAGDCTQRGWGSAGPDANITVNTGAEFIMAQLHWIHSCVPFCPLMGTFSSYFGPYHAFLCACPMTHRLVDVLPVVQSTSFLLSLF